MLIFDDNNDGYLLHNNIQYPNLLWDHDNERFICIRPNSKPEQNQLPIEISVVPYENIQYIQIYQDAKTFVEQNKAELTASMNDEQKKILESMLSRIVTSQVLQ